MASAELFQKPCVRCGVVDRSKKGDCKPCQRERRKAWFQANQTEIKAKPCVTCAGVERDIHGNCIPCRRVRGREWARQNATSVNAKVRLKKYGLTEHQLMLMLQRQGGCCAICECKLSDRYDIDHDHATGEVRGLLCHSCNLGLGHFADNPRSLRQAADYLDRQKVAGAA